MGKYAWIKILLKNNALGKKATAIASIHMPVNVRILYLKKSLVPPKYYSGCSARDFSFSASPDFRQDNWVFKGCIGYYRVCISLILRFL